MEPEPRPAPPRWLDGLEDAALKAVPPPVSVFVRSGSYGEESVHEATEAWRGIRFRTRVLRGGGEPDLTTSLLGTEISSPLAVAPTSMQRCVHAGGEPEMASGVEAAGTLHVVPSNAGTPFARLAGAGPWWLQAYLPTDREAIVPVLDAAVAAGASAVVLTADTPFPGTKYAADAEDWTGIDLGWWRVNFPDPKPDAWARDLTPADVTWLRERADVPVVVKGVLRADDALRCLHAGADAVYVSNHGGRQLDRAVPTAHALREVVAAVGDRAEVYVDGGIRSGLDALAALTLGARGVFLGRPALHGLAVGGARGVTRVLRDLETELREALELAGCVTLDDARDLVPQTPSAGL
jgi:4-hydroxymandelate oxidase